MEIARLGPPDADRVVAASHLFDGPAKAAATERFLDEDGNHLFVAFEGDHAVGFVSAVETTHPDKGTEMFLYELAVEERSRGRGYGRALVEHLAAFAKERGCYGMWVLTESANTAALATYEGAGGLAEPDQVVVVWNF